MTTVSRLYIHQPGYPDNNPKSAVGANKPSLGAIPPAALLHLGQAMVFGAEKYGRMNWREHSVANSVYYDAIMRHLMAWWDGEDRADDSGCHHLAHVMASCAIILDAIEQKNVIEDRPHKGQAAQLIKAMSKQIQIDGAVERVAEELEKDNG